MKLPGKFSISFGRIIFGPPFLKYKLVDISADIQPT